MSKFKTVEDAVKFINGGNSVFTIKSLKTDKHFTYKVNKNKNENSPYFVRVLAGPDNQNWEASQYIGFLSSNWRSSWAEGKLPLVAGKKGKSDAASFKALNWVLKTLQCPQHNDLSNAQFEIMHEGRCCRCNRALTHPDSIESGIGPECAKRA